MYEYRHFFLLRPHHNIWHEELKHRGIQTDSPYIAAISHIQYFIMNMDVEAMFVKFDVS